LAYDWPGNVRELDNVIQRALILQSDRCIDANDLLIDDFETSKVDCEAVNAAKNDKLGSELKLQEHQIILDTLHACRGRRKDVAERLGISPRTLRYKIARMRDSGINIPL
jgi:two-component system response regulator FlrC